MPVFVNEKQLGAIVIASEPGDEIAEVWENATSLAGVALLTGTISIIILYIVFGRVLAPLRSLAEGLRDLGLSDYRVRLPQPKARELSTIAQRFNSLASALETMMVKNRKLSTRLITVQDDERRQTALNLHDEVGPYLFGLKANATSIANSSKGSVAEIRAREMLAMIDALQSINRRVLTQLRPMALGQVPLGELLSSLIAGTRSPVSRHVNCVFFEQAVQQLRRIHRRDRVPLCPGKSHQRYPPRGSAAGTGDCGARKRLQCGSGDFFPADPHHCR